MKKREIWFEATQLLKSPTGHKSGIGYYTENIIKNLALNYKDNDYKIVGNVFLNKKIPNKIAGISNKDILVTRYVPTKVWGQAIKLGIMPKINYLYKGNPDLVVNFDFVRVPVSKRIKTITVIHDLAYEVYPQYTERRNLLRLKKLVPETVKLSNRIVAVSESTKKDIIKKFGVSADKIDVVYNAVDSKKYRPLKLTQQVRARYNLPEKYFLYLGNIEPRKNVEGIIEAYSKLPVKITNEYKLVLAGGMGWNKDTIMKAYNESPHKSSIIFTGYIEDKEIPSVYSAAEIFLFPSHYEGFGLPLLEAMSCGTPVITANNSSLKEVAGDAALYVDSKKTHQLTETIIKILKDDELRIKLVKRGKERIKKFNWANSAEQMNSSIYKALQK